MRQVGVAQQVDAQELAGGPVVDLAGELDEAPAPVAPVVADLDRVVAEAALVAQRRQEGGLAGGGVDPGPQHGGVERRQALDDLGLVGQRAEDLAQLLDGDQVGAVPVAGHRQHDRDSPVGTALVASGSRGPGPAAPSSRRPATGCRRRRGRRRPSRRPPGRRRGVVPSGRRRGWGRWRGRRTCPRRRPAPGSCRPAGRRPPSRGRRRPSRPPPAARRCARRCRAAAGRTARPVHQDREGGVRLLVEADRVAAVAVEVAGDGPHVQAARGAEGDRRHGHALVVEQVEGGVGRWYRPTESRPSPSQSPASGSTSGTPAVPNVTRAPGRPRCPMRRPQPAVPGSYQATPSAPPPTWPWAQRCR